MAVCDRIGLKPKDIDLLVTNQPNRMFLRNWREALELPESRHLDTYDQCGNLFGDEAVIHILKNCVENNAGVYKFVYGMTSSQRTVLRSATDLMLDAMREFDETTRDTEEKEAL